MNRVNANREFYSSNCHSASHLQHLGSSSHTVARLPPRHSFVGIHTCPTLIFDMASTTIRDTIKAVTGQQFVALDQYILQEAGPKLFTIDDLPLIPADKAMLKTSNFTHAFEIIHNAGFMDFQEMHHGLLHNERLPEPLAFKEPVSQVDIQYVHIHEDDGSNTLVKHIYVGSSKVRKLTSQLVSASHGPIYCLDVSKITARRLTPQIVQYLLIGLGGIGLYKFELQLPEIKNPKALCSDAQIDNAYDYIQENAPMSSCNNAILRWITKQKNNPESPVFTWAPVQIEKAITNLIHGKALCQVLVSYPLSLVDFKNWVVQDVLIPCIGYSLQHCIFFAGVSGIGPTGFAVGLGRISVYFVNFLFVTLTRFGCLGLGLKRLCATFAHFSRQNPTCLRDLHGSELEPDQHV